MGALPEDGRLLELGCGWSTVWFANHLGPNQELVSVEHDKGWWEKMIPHVVHDERIDLRFRPPECDPGPYGTHLRENPTGVSSFIFGYPYEQCDVVFIDGLARGACFSAALLECEPGTTIFHHDAQRHLWYGWAWQLAENANCKIQMHPPRDGHPSEMLECRIP